MKAIIRSMPQNNLEPSDLTILEEGFKKIAQNMFDRGLIDENYLPDSFEILDQNRNPVGVVQRIYLNHPNNISYYFDRLLAIFKGSISNIDQVNNQITYIKTGILLPKRNFEQNFPSIKGNKSNGLKQLKALGKALINFVIAYNQTKYLNQSINGIYNQMVNIPDPYEKRLSEMAKEYTKKKNSDIAVLKEVISYLTYSLVKLPFNLSYVRHAELVNQIQNSGVISKEEMNTMLNLVREPIFQIGIAKFSNQAKKQNGGRLDKKKRKMEDIGS